MSSVVFSIDFNQNWLSFDNSDNDQDVLPDAIEFNLPEGYMAIASLDQNDKDGELDIVVYYPGLDQVILKSDVLMTVFLDAGNPQEDFVANVKSSRDPRASFGSPTGSSLPGKVFDGSVLIFGSSVSRTFLPVTLHGR